MLRASEALGLPNLNSYSSADRIGMSGSRMVDSTAIVGRRVICFCSRKLSFYFYVVCGGNTVNAVEYVSCEK